MASARADLVIGADGLKNPWCGIRMLATTTALCIPAARASGIVAPGCWINCRSGRDPVLDGDVYRQGDRYFLLVERNPLAVAGARKWVTGANRATPAQSVLPTGVTVVQMISAVPPIRGPCSTAAAGPLDTWPGEPAERCGPCAGRRTTTGRQSVIEECGGAGRQAVRVRRGHCEALEAYEHLRRESRTRRCSSRRLHRRRAAPAGYSGRRCCAQRLGSFVNDASAGLDP